MQALRLHKRLALMLCLHQDTHRSETCVPDELLVSGYIYVDGYKLLVRDTCRLYLGDIIMVLLIIIIYVTLDNLYPVTRILV